MKSGRSKKVYPERERRVVVAMSGGVDSSVAAALLKKEFDACPERSRRVVGIFMKFWKEGKNAENRCCSAESEKLARLVAKKIDIPFYVINAEAEFKKKVVDYFLKEYKAGNTPNPCVVCNKEIKFGLLIEKALKLGADFVATGHYAGIKNGKLLKGKDTQKDQSYFLWQLNQKQLSKVLFPVGNYTKPEVRELAKKFKLPTAQTPESQEVCFIPALTGRGRQNATNDFLRKYLKSKPGNIIDKSGKVLGKHQGLWSYTIGQRRGIGLSGGPYFVVAKDTKNNVLIVSKDEKDLFKNELVAKNVSWVFDRYADLCDRRNTSILVSGGRLKLPTSAEVKIRCRSNLAKAKILKHGKGIKVIFHKPQKAITPGQSAVFYKGKELLGGGTIDKVI